MPVVEERKEKLSRMDMRLSRAQRMQYEKAAELRGLTLTKWASGHLDECAARDIAEASTTCLAGEDFETCCEMLNEPMPDATKELLARKLIWS